MAAATTLATAACGGEANDGCEQVMTFQCGSPAAVALPAAQSVPPPPPPPPPSNSAAPKVVQPPPCQAAAANAHIAHIENIHNIVGTRKAIESSKRAFLKVGLYSALFWWNAEEL